MKTISLCELVESFPRGNKNLIKMVILDFFLAIEDLIPSISESVSLPKYKSDHFPIKIKLLNNKQTRGMGHWKLNNSLIIYEDYVQKIEDKILSLKVQMLQRHITTTT